MAIKDVKDFGIFADRADVVIFGATPGGIAAAIAAAENGVSAIILEPTNHFGGMMTGGIANTDYLATNYGTGFLTGITKRLFERLADRYKKVSLQIYANEAYKTNLWVAEEALREMLRKAGVRVVYNCLVQSAETGVSANNEPIVTSLVTSKGKFYGGVFIDSSYEGDLLPLAGIGNTIGREAEATYSEPNAGIRRSQVNDVSPLLIPGDLGSGLIFGVESMAELPVTGAADDRIQAVNYRFAATKTGPKTPFPEPETYDVTHYEGVARYIAARGATTMNSMFTMYSVVSPNFDVNNRNWFSTDWMGPEATEYVTATEERRAEIRSFVRNWILGLIKFLKEDARVPEAVRLDVADHGCPLNEFQHREDHFPDYMYVREGRRMIGDFILTQNDVTARNSFNDPIGWITYMGDTHWCRRFAVNGVLQLEGATSVETFTGANIPLRILFPKKAECVNLMPTFATSVSHVAFGAIRMEPTHMQIGEAAGAVAAMSVSRGCAVQDVTYADIRSRIGVQSIFLAPPNGSAFFNANGNATEGTLTKTGTWANETNSENGCHATAAVSSTAGSTARFAPRTNRTKKFRVLVRYPITPTAVDANMALAAPVTVSSLEGVTTFAVCMRGGGSSWNLASGDWESLGEYTFRNGAPSQDYVEFGVEAEGQKTRITAVLFVPA